ncbi:MAG: thiamine pyrophosphate-dependent dehydrogenase E1 component subunit alpha [Oscillospiraceae bacterium]|nr:thiamine pyrophosphate-dependent dehydrogenase E1 component subunit alpha [Oscillospiraceae bacterium]
MSYDKAFKMSMYRNMLEQRVFEKAVQEQYEEGNIPNSAHLYLGQEAIAAGVSMALRPDDYILPSHRGHAQILAKGCDMNRMMAELFGRVDGYCKGKGGSMHLAVAEHGVLGSIGIVGCNMALAVGAGMAAKKNGTGQVAICYFGDGASNRGTFHEGMNLCSIQKLPVIYALENNHYGMFSDYRDMVNVEHISCRAAGYGVPGETVDGNDPWACYEAAKKAIDRARAGEGPSMIEFMTWRHNGHFEGDPDAREFLFRDPKEHEAWLKRDPIVVVRKQLIDEGTCTEDEMVAMEAEVRKQVDEAVAFAHASAWPPVSEVYTDVYAD